MFQSYLENNKLEVPIWFLVVRLKLDSTSKPVNIDPDT